MGGLGYAGRNNDEKTEYYPPSTPTAWAMADPIIFAHQVAHLFGCLHNREEPLLNGGNANEARYGYLMTGSTNSSGRNGKRTIMANADPDRVYTQRINHFSQNYKKSGESYRLGNPANDNTDQIRFSAPFLATIGDESCKCASMCKTCKTCRDADSRGKVFCKQHIWACTDSRYPWFANYNCQKTCGTCTLCTPSGMSPAIPSTKSSNIQPIYFHPFLPVPVLDCLWSCWGAWGSCSTTCGGGTKSRSRTQIQIQQNGGAACQGSYQQSQGCNNQSCPSNITCTDSDANCPN